MKFTGRFFARREDYEEKKTPEDSPFRLFNVSCLRCGSVRLKMLAEFDDESGGAVYLFCPACRSREKLPL